LKKLSICPLGKVWVNCLKSLKKPSIYPLGKTPSAPSVRDPQVLVPWIQMLLDVDISRHNEVADLHWEVNRCQGQVRTTLRDAYTRLFEDNLSALDTDVTQTVRGEDR